MGLDSYWLLPEGNEIHPEFDPPLELCGGLFSENGPESFRGKIYSPFFEHEFNVSLYQEEIPSEEIQQITKKLNDFIETKSKAPGRWSEYLHNDEIKMLSRMFSTYAKLNARLGGWW